MKYRLLKDLPTIKAGAIFQEITREVDGSKILKEYDSNNKNTMLVSEIKNFDEWFEEIKSTDSIHWKPKIGEEYFYISTYGYVESQFWSDDSADNRLMALGIAYRTKEECKKAVDRKLAEARLRQTSDFEPIFESEYGGWIVYFDYENRMLDCAKVFSCDRGELVHYATRADAKKSVKENERDWKIYLGVEEGLYKN